MNTVTAVREAKPADIIESVITKGDLGKLTPQERTRYYVEVCNSVGLNPLTKPFEYILLNNKLTLYALRNCTDQLRTIHGVSVVDMQESEREGVYIVTAKVENRDGRTDMAKGAVTISNLKGDALANAMMKAETKAKRRATLSICGLGFLDETEIETIPAAAKAPTNASPIKPQAIAAPTHDPQTGEVGPHKIPLPTGGSPYIAWGQLFIAAVNAAQSTKEIGDWIEANKKTRKDIAKDAPKVAERITANVDAAIKRFDGVAGNGADVPTPTDPEAFRAYVLAKFKEAKDADALDGAWETYVEPAKADIFPPDLSELTDAFNATMSEIE